MNLNEISRLIKDVPDFPKKGIVFKDMTPVLADPTAFKALTSHMCELMPKNIKKIVAIESRGFILGAAMAQQLGLGLVLVRKPGKLPRKTLSHSYSLEYGEDTLQIHAEDLTPGEEIAIVDDVLATGGTAHATEQLCEKLGANVKALVFLMEIDFLQGSKKLKAPHHTLLHV